ncbi:hypothetical protein QCA50_010428 [Cerrena zonata]|uniref:Uncharacterized protein n=1 Tax=Cerrena zonata TaxID=2478898 RepID=A0AAW0G8B0_9APHY
MITHCTRVMSDVPSLIELVSDIGEHTIQMSTFMVLIILFRTSLACLQHQPSLISMACARTCSVDTPSSVTDPLDIISTETLQFTFGERTIQMSTFVTSWFYVLLI